MSWLGFKCVNSLSFIFHYLLPVLWFLGLYFISCLDLKAFSTCVLSCFMAPPFVLLLPSLIALMCFTCVLLAFPWVFKSVFYLFFCITSFLTIPFLVSQFCLLYFSFFYSACAIMPITCFPNIQIIRYLPGGKCITLSAVCNLVLKWPSQNDLTTRKILNIYFHIPSILYILNIYCLSLLNRMFSYLVQLHNSFLDPFFSTN